MSNSANSTNSSNTKSGNDADKSTTRNNKARPAGLSRERIIKAAYQLAKKDAVTALSMRRIANKLKVTPMAIYKYFSDKNELIAAVIDTHMKKSNLTPEDIDPDLNWRDWTQASFLAMWDAYDAAPSMIGYMGAATSFGPAVLHWENETLRVLIKAGLTPSQALTGHAAMAELAIGSSILVPIRKKGVEVIFPSIWKDLKEGKAPVIEEGNNDANSLVEYPWLLMCGQAMLQDMQDPRTAFTQELDLILDRLQRQIEDN